MLLGHGRCRFRPALDVVAQILGAVIGGWTAHLMFGLPILQSSAHARGTTGEWVGEFVATFGSIGLILSAGRHKPAALPYGIAAYITGAYRFTSSTAFANPAVTLARALTDSFARIQPSHVLPFIAAELAGGAAAAAAFGWLLGRGKARTAGIAERSDPISTGWVTRLDRRYGRAAGRLDSAGTS